MTMTKVVPFRNDMVGSFLRPKAIKEAREAVKEGKLSQEGLHKIEDREIRNLVEKQVEVGLKAVTDGEFRRSWWHLDFMWGLDGVEKSATESGLAFNGIETRKESASITGKIDFSTHPFVEDYNYLASIVPEGVIAKQTLPSAVQFLYEITKPHNIENTKKAIS